MKFVVQDRDKLLCVFICPVGYVGASSLLSWLLASSSLLVNFFFFFLLRRNFETSSSLAFIFVFVTVNAPINSKLQHPFPPGNPRPSSLLGGGEF